MNRAERLRKVVPGAPDDVITELASLPLAEVDRIVALARQARRDGVEHERELRRQRRRSRKDDDDLAAGVARQSLKLAERAMMTMETLTRLKQQHDYTAELLGLAVAGARAQGYTDSEIGRALGVTRQAVWNRWGSTGRVYPADPAAAAASGSEGGAPGEPSDRLRVVQEHEL